MLYILHISGEYTHIFLTRNGKTYCPNRINLFTQQNKAK